MIGLGLASCGQTDGADVSRGDAALSDPQAASAPPFALEPEMEDGTTSPIIEALLVRRSVLEPGSLRDVALAVMAANTRASEADLRAALLRAEAESYNWLPTIGPSVSLTSLGSVVASLVVNAALIDHGARRAERDYAKHDVEVAAVALAEDSNSRVMQALELYVRAEAARARADVTARAMERMDHFAYIMRERVAAGISDRADLQVVTQKQNQMASDMASDRETAGSAMRQLQAMTASPVTGLSGLSGLSDREAPSLTAEALSVMRARAESARAVASAKAAQAGLLPGVGIGGSVGTEGNDLGVTAAAANGIGLGLGASMRAIEAEEQAAAARVGAEREAAERAIAALEGEVQSLRRQHGEAVRLARQATENYELFAEQQRAGQRGVTEVVGVFETKIRADRAATQLRYDIVLAELRIAERLGLLVDGDKM